MSDLGESWGRDTGGHPGARRLVTLGVALVAVLVVVGGGSLVQPEDVSAPPARVPLVGRTSSICAVPVTEGDQADQPQGTTSVSGVSVRQSADQDGKLTGTPLTSNDAELTVSEQGKGAQIASAKAAIVLEAEGAMATASSGVVFGVATSGTDTGLSAAPCLAPGTQHWFTGIGAGDADRTELILTNPDDAQAEVDLRYFGRRGLVVVAGSPGVVVEAHSSRTVSLATLDPAEGPFSIQIQASSGRVAAIARRTRTDQLKPAGADWQVPTAPPSQAVLIPGVPDNAGPRDLVVANPGGERATVQVQILGVQGPFAPSGAASVEVPAESTVSVDLAPGLAGESGSIQLTSDRPVTASVVSASDRDSAGPDLAVQSAALPLVRTGVSALATTNSAEAELTLSNGGDTDAPVTFEVLSYDGVTLRTDDVLIAAHSTATRRLNSPAPSYLVVQVPDGSEVVGGIVLTQPDGDVAGLATIPLTSPDLASRAPTTTWDPSAGR